MAEVHSLQSFSILYGIAVPGVHIHKMVYCADLGLTCWLILMRIVRVFYGSRLLCHAFFDSCHIDLIVCHMFNSFTYLKIRYQLYSRDPYEICLYQLLLRVLSPLSRALVCLINVSMRKHYIGL